MSEGNFELVKSWMERAGQGVPDTFQYMDDETVRLRSKLILEECMETLGAMGVAFGADDWVVNLSRPADGYPTILDENLPPNRDRYIELIDGLCDILYVVYGTFVSMGLDVRPFFEEVHRSNLSKLEGVSHDEDGKVQKGAGFSPPDLDSVLLGEQGL